MPKEYIVPTDARREYKALIQRANRRILSNLNYIKDEGIKDVAIKHSLAHNFTKKKSWAGKSTPLSSSIKFTSETEYKKYINFVKRWGEDTGKRGGYRADPNVKLAQGKEAVYKAVYGLLNHKGISLEKWGGGLPDDLVKNIESMSLEQVSRFFEHVDVTGEEDLYDSDQVQEDSIDDALDYIQGRIATVQHYYPKAQSKKKKRKKKKKSRRKTKGRKKH